MTKLFFLPTLINKPISMQICFLRRQEKKTTKQENQTKAKERAKRGRRQKAKIVDAFKDNNRKSLFLFLSLNKYNLLSSPTPINCNFCN